MHVVAHLFKTNELILEVTMSHFFVEGTNTLPVVASIGPRQVTLLVKSIIFFIPCCRLPCLANV